MTTEMKGKVCLLTGGTNGFGFEAAKTLAGLGATVVLVSRSEEKGKAIQKAIHKATGQTVSLLYADLLSMAEVKRVARAFREQFERLDVLVNNAGYAYTPREVTDEGFEKTFALNYLAYVTLTVELLDMLVDGAPTRIINTASEAHRWDEIDFDNLQGEVSFPPGQFGMPMMYGWSNVYRLAWTYTLADALRDKGVTVNAFCPGFVPVKRTGMPWFLNMLAPLMSLMPSARSPKVASQMIVRLATEPTFATETGLYFSRDEKAESTPQTLDDTVQKRLWSETRTLLGYEIDPLA